MNLFLFGCIPFRLALVLLAAYGSAKILRYMSVPAFLIAVGFLIIFVFGLRKTGRETGGKPIWWNALRPVHALFYLAFAYLAFRGQVRYAWVPLALDVILGLVAYTWHHNQS